MDYYDIMTLCDSAHFNVDFNTVIGELQKKYGADIEGAELKNYYPSEVCNLIKKLIISNAALNTPVRTPAQPTISPMQLAAEECARKILASNGHLKHEFQLTQDRCMDGFKRDFLDIDAYTTAVKDYIEAQGYTFTMNYVHPAVGAIWNVTKS